MRVAVSNVGGTEVLSVCSSSVLRAPETARFFLRSARKKMFPNLLYVLRLRRLSQGELARMLAISEPRLSRCLRGHVEFVESEKAKISELLGVELTWLFSKPMPPNRIGDPVQR